MELRRLLIASVLLLVSAVPARAQVGWDSPMFAPPIPTPGIGIILVEPAYGDLGVMGMYRPAPTGLGFRAGIAEEGGGDDIAFFGGIDLGGVVARRTADFPLHVTWVAGAGAGIGDGALLSFPIGLSLGATLPGEQVTVLLYGTPRFVLDAFLGGEDAGDDVELEFAADLGADLQFQPGWKLRFAVTLGRDAIGIGIVF